MYLKLRFDKNYLSIKTIKPRLEYIYIYLYLYKSANIKPIKLNKLFIK